MLKIWSATRWDVGKRFPCLHWRIWLCMRRLKSSHVLTFLPARPGGVLMARRGLGILKLALPGSGWSDHLFVAVVSLHLTRSCGAFRIRIGTLSRTISRGVGDRSGQACKIAGVLQCQEQFLVCPQERLAVIYIFRYVSLANFPRL